MKAISESQLWKKRLGDWVVNPFVGCEHGCLHCYCPSMPGVRCFNGGRSQREWGDYLLPKPGFVEALRRQLKTFTPDKAKRTDWGNGWVLMSFLTDCYTPAEAKLKVTRECLKLLLDAGHKVRVQTRSALVERDFDLLSAHRDRVLLGTSLPYLDDDLARVLEPRAAAPTRRLAMLRNAAQAGIPVYVAIAPVMPWQGPADVALMLEKVRPLSPREIFCEVLNPKGENLSKMLDALVVAGQGGKVDDLKRYTDTVWAANTYTIAYCGLRYHPRFVPWPDTGRDWARHLEPDQAAWLDQFLPPQP